MSEIGIKLQDNKQDDKRQKKVRRALQCVCAIALILCVCLPFALFSAGQDVGVAEASAIKRGMSGAQVRTVQTKLNELGFSVGKVDGIFGKNTYNAVINFQKNRGLTVDGIVGKNTAKSMGISLTSSTTSNGSYGSADIYLLAKCIYAEARGESYTGQVAVGAVILNRVKSKDFPSTVAGVIYQPWAFTAVHDGQINLAPNDSAKKAAMDAINGWDPSGGCIYYYNPAATTNKWIWSRQVLVVIGRHRFAV